jgi:hypothetical protein
LLGAGAQADGEDGVVFGENEGVADRAGEVLCNESLLGGAGGLVARAAPVYYRARAGWRDRGRMGRHGGKSGTGETGGQTRAGVRAAV